MIFTSFEFVLFFLLVLVLRGMWRSFEGEKRFLLVASYLFYMSWNVACGGLILFTSLVDFYVGRRLAEMESPGRRKGLLVLSLVINLGLLGFFKYTNFLGNNVVFLLSLVGVTLNPVHFDIILPAGVSFFTFQSMSYTIDVYRRQLAPCRNVRDFLLFVAFFPQLVAGPIVRAADFLPQLTRRVRGSWMDIEAGLVLFAVGAVKKIVISDNIASHVDTIFANPGAFDAATLLQGLLGYAVQIYCDFSGYSDMAIGCARMMGFRFMDNFAMPYSALSIAEFWRRWHMSLSAWLRDYLYVPLGGNRRGVARTYVNLMLTMLLGGLWHGASWNFVVWGGLHGVALVVHKAWLTLRPPPAQPSGRIRGAAGQIASRALTLGVVLVGWIFFRAQGCGNAWIYFSRLATWNTSGTFLLSHTIVPAVAAVVVTHLLIYKDRHWAEEILQASLPWRIVVYASLLLLIVTLGATNSAAFIYFRF